MFSRFNKALNDRRAGLKREEGFTLIELLVVVIIIGILAAIAVPIYLGVQTSAKDSAVNTDVTNAKIALIAWQTDNPTATAYTAIGADATASVYGPYGATQSSNTTSLTITGTNTFPKFCITGLGVSTTKFYITDSSGATKTKPANC